MKNSKIQQVAEKAGVSVSAVSKTLHHCPGIGNDVREAVLDIATQEGIYRHRRNVGGVYLIMPETPAYFWKRAYDVLLAEFAAENIPVKCNVYSGLGDKKVVETYLAEAETRDANLIIISALHEGLEQRLSKIAESRGVFSYLCPIDTPHVFYFGTKEEQMGRMIAEKCLEENPNPRRILTIGFEDSRMKAFRDITNHIPQTTIHLKRKETPIRLAREIDRVSRETPFDVVVCFDGITSIVCMAMKKCGISVPFYGLEDQFVEERYKVPIGAVCQDIEGIAKSLVSAAKKYMETQTFPGEKFVYTLPKYRKK